MATEIENIEQSLFRPIRKSPSDEKYYGLAQTAVNAISIANSASWKTTFKELLNEARLLCLMPNDKKCIISLLEKNSFVRQPGIKESFVLDNVVKYMNENCRDGQEVIVELLYGGGAREYFAIVPCDCRHFHETRDQNLKYQAYGFKYPGKAAISDIWVRWKDGLDHSPVKRRKRSPSKTKPHKIPADHEAFHYRQENPQEYTGDCVIRALASACKKPWGDVIFQIAKASNYANTTLNTAHIYTQYLKQEGFEVRKPMKHNGRLLTGKEFCRELDKVLLGGERVFAYVGRSHVAAVLPFTEAGVTHYKIVDSWDSSSKSIGEYWIKPISNRSAYLTASEICTIGATIQHPVLGKGRVLDVHHSGWMGVTFEINGYRRLDSRWVMHNCQVIPLLIQK